MQQAFRLADAAGSTGRIGPGRDRIKALEQDVALDAETHRQAGGDHFGEAEGAELGFAEIGQAEQGVAVLVKFGHEPDAFAERVEELHHGDVIGVAVPAVGQELLAQFVGEEDHAALLSIAGSADSASPSAGTKPSSQSAALLAWLAARTMARLSSRSTSSQEPM